MASGGLNFRGLNLVSPINRLANGFCTVAANLRAYFKGGVTFRNLLTDALYTLSTAVHTIRRLNDSTPAGPPSGFSVVNGAGTVLSIWNSTIGVKNLATGLSGNPISLIPFRPNASVQPWMYSADPAPMGNVEITTEYLISGDPTTFATYGMLKVRSDGLIFRAGIEEPQLAPVVSTQNTNVTVTGTLEATAIPWTNYDGANSDYDYGETHGYPNPGPTPPIDGTAPFVVDVLNASFITINSITGTADINGNPTATPTTLGPSPSSATNPGHFVMEQGTGTTPPATATVVIGAFADGSGNVIAAGVAPLYIPSVTDVGATIGVTNGITVPFGAATFQIGINSTGNTFNSNSGSFAINLTVTTDALPSVTSILGTLSLAYWGDSPTSGPTGSYIWKNPDDPGGSGPTRSISDAIGTTTGNSFIFDATFSGGLPGLPGIGSPSVPMLWTTLSPESVAIGSNAVFAAPITNPYTTNTGFNNFNFCLTGNIYFPAPGNYTFVLTNHDDMMWGIGGGVTFVSATVSGSGEGGSATISDYGQTITVVGGYPLLPRQQYTSGSGGNYAQTTVVVSVPNAGIYPIEVDYDYWYHSGRILLIDATPGPGPATGPNAPTIIPPLPSNVRQDVQYRYVYRSSATGATSNPSPESAAQTIPVIANTITSLWSPDPQVDVVDYYRIDSVTAQFTYVNTGPNDDLGTVPGTNTPVTDSLTDTELGDQLLNYDNYEPFPSIDLPQKGVCSVSGGVITWVSGGSIGGSATGFNIRWLAGTEILIGSPTSLAYTFIARPTSNTSVTIPGVPDGTNLAYEIPEPILAAQPLPYLWGPTDNINFAYAVGDPLRPGTLYWCAGSNLDAAPDTNQQDVTDPGEPLVNGAISGGLGVVFSIKRAWLILPNFFNATATATGTTGSTWSLQESSITRGLYIPRCVCVSGGGNIFFRVDDGIHISVRGSASKSITDETLYPLFSHENSDTAGNLPVPIVREGVTIYPPDDTQPQLQKFSYQNGYMYWDYGYQGKLVPVLQSASFTPDSVVTEGEGIPWIDPANATGEGIGTNQVAQITGFSISSNVVSFTTALQQDPLVATQTVVISAMEVGTYLNGQTLTVSASGLSSTGFSASFAHADVASTFDIGIASPTTTYTYAFNGPYTPPGGQNSVLVVPTGTQNGPDRDAGTCFGAAFAPWTFLAAEGYGIGVNGCPLGAPAVGWDSTYLAIPTLPAGAVVQSMIPVVIGTHYGTVGNVFFQINYPPSGNYTFNLFGGLQTGPNLGTDLTILPSTYFSLLIDNSLESPPGTATTFGGQITYWGVMVNYTAPGTPISSTQLQTLVATNLGLAIPSDSPVTGVQVNVQTGMLTGAAASLEVQLTLAGTPVGTAKSISVGSWATSYVLGGDADDWGISGLTGAQVNGSDGLGVNISGSLPANAQINLNDLNGEVFYTVEEETEGSATLVFDEAAMGWVWDLYNPNATVHAANEGQSQQGVLVGCADGSVRQLATNGTETITGTVMTPAFGGRGYNHVGEAVIEYSSTSTVTLNIYPADEGSGSYGSPTITLPATGGALTKYWLRPGANKWKLAWAEFSSTVPFILNFQGTVFYCKSWGSTAAYQPIPIFGSAGGEG